MRRATSESDADGHDEEQRSPSPRSRTPMRPRWSRSPRPTSAFAKSQVRMAIKLLLSTEEASCVLGPAGSTCREIGQASGTKLHLSGRNEFYPRTSLQELSIWGSATEAISASVLSVFTRIAEAHGRIENGEADTPEGHARAKFVIPIFCTKALIGKGGRNVKAMCAGSGLKVHVDEESVGYGETSEQIVRISGTLDELEAAIPTVVDHVAAASDQPWFSAWAQTSHAGQGPPETETTWRRPASGKGPPDTETPWRRPASGKGFGKGHSALPALAGQPPPLRPLYQAYGKDYQPPARHGGEKGLRLQRGDLDSQLDIIADAIQALPDDMAYARTQQVVFNCPAESVSSVIGKGGSGVREIGQLTGTRITIRDIEDNPFEKSVNVSGGAVGLVTAYLLLLGRVAGDAGR